MPMVIDNNIGRRFWKIFCFLGMGWWEVDKTKTGLIHELALFSIVSGNISEKEAAYSDYNWATVRRGINVIIQII